MALTENNNILIKQNTVSWSRKHKNGCRVICVVPLVLVVFQHCHACLCRWALFLKHSHLVYRIVVSTHFTFKYCFLKNYFHNDWVSLCVDTRLVVVVIHTKQGYATLRQHEAGWCLWPCNVLTPCLTTETKELYCLQHL